jgi:hypothetical protein
MKLWSESPRCGRNEYPSFVNVIRNIGHKPNHA